MDVKLRMVNKARSRANSFSGPVRNVSSEAVTCRVARAISCFDSAAAFANSVVLASQSIFTLASNIQRRAVLLTP